MLGSWQEAFTRLPDVNWSGPTAIEGMLHLTSLQDLKRYLDWVHIKLCLLKPYFETQSYPLVESRALLPSFELDVYEHKELPGFSMVALARPLNSFNEIFQFDRLNSVMDFPAMTGGAACPLMSTIIEHNLRTMRSRLPRRAHDSFQKTFEGRDTSWLESYPAVLPFLLQSERAHVMSMDANGEFYLSGIYASLPSDLDTEIKRFGLRIGKFKPGDSCRYERNRLFVYQYLMELHGFPIVSERRTSASLFARRLQRMGEKYLVRVLGQSDRTLTTLSSTGEARRYPRIEKTALVAVEKEQSDVIRALDEKGFFVDPARRTVILRVTYTQHKYNSENVQQDRALSVSGQEIIHPVTGEVLADVNIIKDASNMILRLTDIVRGEYAGIITFKRQEIVRDTETHDKRLKFLFAWLSKHQRRIIGYSDEFYAGVVKILDSYLLSPDNYDHFNGMHDLYQEVWAKYSYIQQARKVKLLEDLKERNYKGRKVGYLEMLEVITDLLNDLKFEIVNYFDELVENVLRIGEHILNDAYILRSYIAIPEDDLSHYGRKVRKHYRRLVSLLDEFKSIRKSRKSRPPAYSLQNEL